MYIVGCCMVRGLCLPDQMSDVNKLSVENVIYSRICISKTRNNHVYAHKPPDLFTNMLQSSRKGCSHEAID